VKKTIFLLLIFVINAFADDAHLLTVSGGIFDIKRESHRTAQVYLEYKPNCNFRKIRPFVGSMVTFKGSFYLYGGLALELFFNKNLFLIPNLAMGYYNKGSGKNLGYPLEFRSGIEFGWDFRSYRLSLIGFHISNAHLGRHNPGEESVALNLSIPFKKHK